LNSNDNKVLFIPGGFGHGFFAKEDSVVTYSIGSRYSPEFEKEISIFDLKLNLIREEEIRFISKKDKDAISLDEALTARLLPDWR
jgi:dTDP-4-dehydrorhamnose 3,5-epimerase-like enzyme